MIGFNPLLLYVYSSQGISYSLDIKGCSDKKLLENFKNVSPLAQNTFASSSTVLKNRANSSVSLFKKILQSQGFFDAIVDVTINDTVVQVNVTQGRPYNFGKIIITGADFPNSKHLEGASVTFRKIDNLTGEVVEQLKQTGYPFAAPLATKLKVNPDQKTIDVDITIKTGKKCRFGKAIIIENKSIKTKIIEAQVAWQPGTLYDERLLDKTRQNLLETHLISTASVKPVKRDGDIVDIRIKTAASMTRTVAGEVFFSTAEGPGGEVSWENRNLWNGGQRVHTAFRYSKYRAFVKAGFLSPYISRHNFESANDLIFSREDTNAFFSRTYEAQTYLSKKFGQYAKAGIGLFYENGYVSKTENIKWDATKKKPDEPKKIYDELTKKFYPQLLTIPFYINVDTTDNKLNPTSGIDMRLNFNPYCGRYGFSQVEGSLAHVFSLKYEKLFWFNKVHVGQTFGREFDDLFPHKRFYLGGVKKMRAYGYQLVGDTDAKGVPYGGRNFGFFMSEMRYKITPRIGINLFHEMGIVSKKEEFLDGKIFHGTGCCFCYYSNFGPIQIGIAVPWTRRKNIEGKHIDSIAQIYVSIGQIR